MLSLSSGGSLASQKQQQLQKKWCWKSHSCRIRNIKPTRICLGKEERCLSLQLAVTSALLQVQEQEPALPKEMVQSLLSRRPREPSLALGRLTQNKRQPRHQRFNKLLLSRLWTKQAERAEHMSARCRPRPEGGAQTWLPHFLYARPQEGSQWGTLPTTAGQTSVGTGLGILGGNRRSFELDGSREESISRLQWEVEQLLSSP